MWRVRRPAATLLDEILERAASQPLSYPEFEMAALVAATK
jgi:hypothetical protein